MRVRYETEEKPEPKSSSAMRMPAFFSSHKVGRTFSMSRITSISVSSSVSAEAGISVASRACCAERSSVGWRRWRTLTLTETPGMGTPASCQRRSCCRASEMAHSPMRKSRPLSSASGMNLPGESICEPRIQRISASTPTTRL